MDVLNSLILDSWNPSSPIFEWKTLILLLEDRKTLYIRFNADDVAGEVQYQLAIDDVVETSSFLFKKGLPDWAKSLLKFPVSGFVEKAKDQRDNILIYHTEAFSFVIPLSFLILAIV